MAKIRKSKCNHCQGECPSQLSDAVTDVDRLREAVNDMIESSQGGERGEIICDADDFAAVENLMTINFMKIMPS